MLATLKKSSELKEPRKFTSPESSNPRENYPHELYSTQKFLAKITEENRLFLQRLTTLRELINSVETIHKSMILLVDPITKLSRKKRFENLTPEEHNVLHTEINNIQKTNALKRQWYDLTHGGKKQRLALTRYYELKNTLTPNQKEFFHEFSFSKYSKMQVHSEYHRGIICSRILDFMENEIHSAIKIADDKPQRITEPSLIIASLKVIFDETYHQEINLMLKTDLSKKQEPAFFNTIKSFFSTKQKKKISRKSKNEVSDPLFYSAKQRYFEKVILWAESRIKADLRLLNRQTFIEEFAFIKQNRENEFNLILDEALTGELKNSNAIVKQKFVAFLKTQVFDRLEEAFEQLVIEQHGDALPKAKISIDITKELTTLATGKNLADLTSKRWASFIVTVKSSHLSSLNLSGNELFQLSPLQWHDFFVAVKAAGIKILDLSDNDLDQLSDQNFAAFITGLETSGISSLSLSKNNINKWSPLRWKKLFAACQKSKISSLDLSYNNLANIANNKYGTYFFRELGISGITSINLSSNNLYKLTAQQWRFLFQQLTQVSTLDLSHNNIAQLTKELEENTWSTLLFKWSSKKWTVFCEAISFATSLTSLNLNDNNLNVVFLEYLFGRPFISHWQEFFIAVKKAGLTSLDLSNNNLNQMSPEQWITFFANLKISGVTSLDLSGNNLSQLGLKQQEIFLTGLKISGLVSLKLSNTYFNKTAFSFWEKIFTSAITTNLTIDFSGNDINLLPPDHWTTLFAAVKKAAIVSLNLSKMNLGELPPKQWEAFLDGLKMSGITSLNLSENNFNLLSCELWKKFENTLKSTRITYLNISSNNLKEERINVLDSIIHANYRKSNLIHASLKDLCQYSLWRNGAKLAKKSEAIYSFQSDIYESTELDKDIVDVLTEGSKHQRFVY